MLLASDARIDETPVLFFFHKTRKQCENKSLVLNVIRYGCGSTG